MEIEFKDVVRKPEAGVAALYRHESQAETICSWLGKPFNGVGNWGSFSVWDGVANIRVNKGNWIILHETGSFEIMTQREFERAF